jgi:hypothetical protein
MFQTNPMIGPTEADDSTSEVEDSTELSAASSADQVSGGSFEGSWERHVERLLRRAAEVAGEHGANLEGFVNAAYGLFLDTNPEVRSRMAEARMLEELETLRSAGLIGNA